jgi:hypothetical protein
MNKVFLVNFSQRYVRKIKSIFEDISGLDIDVV